MFEVEFYEDRHGKQPVKEILIELRDKAHTSKDARIQYQKILTHIRALEIFGTRVGEPQVKHIDGNLWELRPLAHRIFFFLLAMQQICSVAPFYQEISKNAAQGD